ncbi:MAG: GNAT family N-acetyltransferase [Tateyamaria sp.]
MIAFRTATERELSTVLGWAADEGWNPGIDDAAAFFAADPGGFFVAVDGAEPVAAISVVNHTPDFAFLGLYIVRPAHRGKGIGIGLWRHAMAHAGPRCVGLDGVPEQQANYVRSGFTRAGSTTRFEGSVEAAAGSDIRPATDADIPAMIGMEGAASGVQKRAYMSAWFTNTLNRRSYCSEDGLVTIRKCRVGAKIGPLVALDADSAWRLIRHAAGAFDGPVIVDVPAQSEALARKCAARGLTPGFETARMYRGPAITGSNAVYAVASLELG